MKLILIVLGVAVVVVVAPFIILWNAGKYGPALAFVLAGIALGVGGSYVLPSLDVWPSTKSQLTVVSGRVTKAYGVSRGGASWYEVELSTTVGRHSLPSSLGQSDVTNTIGANLELGCISRPGFSCQTVSVISDGHSLVDYSDKLREHDRDVFEREQLRQWVFMAAGGLLLVGGCASIVSAMKRH